MSNKNHTYFWNLLLLITLIIQLGAFFIIMPSYIDDYMFSEKMACWYRLQDVYNLSDGGNVFKTEMPIEILKQIWHQRWIEDNIRLGNIVVNIFLLFPKWIGSAISCLLWIYSISKSIRMMGINIKKSSLLALAVIMWSLFIPWPNHMGSLVYQFNYIWPTALSICLFWILSFGYVKFNRKILSFSAGFGTFVLGIIVGWWHEGFSIPVLIGLVSLVVLFRNCRNLYFYLGIVGLLIGISILAMAPGTRVRMGQADMELGVKIAHILAYNIPYYIFILISVLVWGKKGKNIILRDRVLVFCIVSGAVPILMSMVTFAASRVTWWSQIVAIIGIMKLIKEYGSNYWNRYSIRNLVWIVPLLILSFLRLGYLDVYAVKMRKLLKESLAEYISNPEKPVFAEIVTNDQLPLIAVKITDVIETDQQKAMAAFLSAWTGQEDFRIIPSQLQNVTKFSGQKLSGMEGARIYDNLLFFDGDAVDFQNYQLLFFNVDYGIMKQRVRSYAFRFKSEADGREYVFVNLMHPWPLRNFRKVEGIEPLEVTARFF